MIEQEIHQTCEKYNITNYKIHPDMTVDVDGDVILEHNELLNIPLKFGRVTGDFYCDSNQLTSLIGCPNYVGEQFSCEKNNIATLEGCPHYVGNSFWCSYNRITTLQHLPINFYIGGNFYYNYNYHTENDAKEYGKLFFGHIGGQISTVDIKLNKFLNEHKNPPKKNLPKLLSELRKITVISTFP